MMKRRMRNIDAIILGIENYSKMTINFQLLFSGTLL